MECRPLFAPGFAHPPEPSPHAHTCTRTGCAHVVPSPKLTGRAGKELPSPAGLQPARPFPALPPAGSLPTAPLPRWVKRRLREGPSGLSGLPAPRGDGQQLLTLSLLPGLWVSSPDASVLRHQGAEAEPLSAPRRATSRFRCGRCREVGPREPSCPLQHPRPRGGGLAPTVGP